MIYTDKRQMRTLLLYALAGLGAGVVNGLAGTGAGVVFLLFFGLTGGGMSKTVFSVSMACVIPLSVVSLMTYPAPLAEHIAMLPWIALFAGLGGLMGAWIQKKVRVRLLKFAFAGLVIWAGLRMML